MTAWEVLLRCGITELPVDLAQVCRGLGLGLYSYTQGYRVIQRCGLARYLHGADGFLFREADGPLAVVFYNPHQSQGRRCFTIAHEIAHFALGHLGPVGREVVRREPDGQDSPEERDADRFAAQLLAPPCVLRGLRLRHPFEIGQTCRLSIQAAAVCSARMERLLELDAQWLRERGCSYFFRSPMEWKLYRQFEPFIRARAPRRPDRALHQ